MSFNHASDVSPTTGLNHGTAPRGAKMVSTMYLTTPSYTDPTLKVFVRRIGVSIRPNSSIRVNPAVVPAPLKVHEAASTGWWYQSLPGGSTAVTPVRTGPCLILSGPSPLINVT